MGDNDSRFSVTVGKGVSRRDVMKQLGALTAVGGLAGCLQQEEATTTGGGGDGDDEDDGSSAPSYQRVDLARRQRS